jgi:hypothetical protein
MIAWSVERRADWLGCFPNMAWVTPRLNDGLQNHQPMLQLFEFDDQWIVRRFEVLQPRASRSLIVDDGKPRRLEKRLSRMSQSERQGVWCILSVETSAKHLGQHILVAYA